METEHVPSSTSEAKAQVPLHLSSHLGSAFATHSYVPSRVLDPQSSAGLHSQGSRKARQGGRTHAKIPAELLRGGVFTVHMVTVCFPPLGSVWLACGAVRR